MIIAAWLQAGDSDRTVELQVGELSPSDDESSSEQFNRIANQHSVPSELHFVLATLVRQTRSSDPQSWGLAIHLLALAVLLESQPDKGSQMLEQLLLECPKLFAECFALIAPTDGDPVPVAVVQVGATAVLTSLNQDRAQQAHIIAAAGINEATSPTV